VKFNIYNRFVLDIVRKDEAWQMFMLDSGKRIRVNDFAIPSWIDESGLPQFLDDIYHEMGEPGDVIVRMD
jgi:hypothetical protein